MSKNDENTLKNFRDEDSEFSESSDAKKYGITRSAVSYFHYLDYKYTNLKDAINQAKRNEAAAKCGRP